MQTNLEKVTTSDQIVLVRTIVQMLDDIERYILPEYGAEFTEPIAGLVDYYGNCLDIIPKCYEDALGAVMTANTRMNIQLLQCKLTGCANTREHEYYQAIIDIALYARDKVIDGCLSEGIIPGVSPN